MNHRLNKIGYVRNDIISGILHIGVGNFHRAHEACYTNELLGIDPTQKMWGISGAMLLPGDERLFRAMKEQKGRYTLTVCGRDGVNHTHEIGSIIDILWAKEDAGKILDKIAAPNI